MLLTIGMACIPNSTNLLMIPEMNLQCDKQIAHDGHPEVVAVVLKQIMCITACKDRTFFQYFMNIGSRLERRMMCRLLEQSFF